MNRGNEAVKSRTERPMNRENEAMKGRTLTKKREGERGEKERDNPKPNYLHII